MPTNFRVDSEQQLYGYTETMMEAEALAAEKAQKDNCVVTVRTTIGRHLIAFSPGDKPRRLDYGKQKCQFCQSWVEYDVLRGAHVCKCGASFSFKQGWTAPKGRRHAPPVSRNMFGQKQYIKLLTDKNPKRPGSKSHERFALYRDGMTVYEFLQAGGTREDLRWDSDRGFIEIK